MTSQIQLAPTGIPSFLSPSIDPKGNLTIHYKLDISADSEKSRNFLIIELKISPGKNSITRKVFQDGMLIVENRYKKVKQKTSIKSSCAGCKLVLDCGQVTVFPTVTSCLTLDKETLAHTAYIWIRKEKV